MKHTFISSSHIEYSMCATPIAATPMAASPIATSRRASRLVSRSSRRRGQALLISVLLMVFASVLAATFVTVVALNLSQTARSGSVASAKQAALAGRNFVNDQLTNSEKGERWLPEVDAQGAPPIGDTYYYTDFERAKGWDQQSYVKFPDPRSATATASGGSVFLTKVTEITPANYANLNLTTDFIGQLKVDVIGRADDNDAAFDKLTFYKPTSANGNFTGFARYISNWDFSKSRDENIEFLTSSSAPTSTLVGTLLDTDFDVEGDGTAEDTDTPEQNSQGSSLIHGNVNLVGKTRFILPTNSDKFALTGLVTTNTTAFVSDSIASAGETFPTTATANPTALQQRVLIGANNADPTSRTGIVKTITPARLDTPNSRWRQLSQYADIQNGSQYGYGDDPARGGGVYIDNATDVEKVGRGNNTTQVKFRTLSVIETQRLMQRKSFPVNTVTAGEVGNADIGAGLSNGEYTTGTQNVHRLAYPRPTPVLPAPTPTPSYIFPIASQVNTAISSSYDPSLEERGLRGWINGREFLPRGVLVELKGDTIVVTRDDLSDQSAYRRDNAGNIIYSTDALGNFIVDFLGNRTPEQNPSFQAPDPGKVWKDNNGNPLRGSYRMEINVGTGTRTVRAANATTLYSYAPPSGRFNGVIFAEGNVRVRGYTRTKNITVVSMGNIYVEGGINKSSTALPEQGNVALLAKRNVVFNPTQIMAHVEGSQASSIADGNSVAYTVNTTTTVLATTSIVSSPTFPVVYRDLPLRVGDQFRLGGNDSQWRIVTTIAGGASPYTITFTPAVAAATVGSTGNIRVLNYVTTRRQADVALDGGNSNGDTATRDVKMDGEQPVGSYFVSLLHSAQRLPALGSSGQAGNMVPDTAGATYDIKTDASGNGRIEDVEKVLNLTASTPASYNLLNADGIGTNGGDAVETILALRRRFFTDGVGGIVNGVVDGTETRVNPTWSIFTDGTPSSPYDTVAARRYAIQTETLGGAGSYSANLQLTTSVGLFWQQNLDTLTNAVAPLHTIGSSFDPLNLPAAYDTSEDAVTVTPNFYGTAPRPYGLSLLTSPDQFNSNIIALRRDQSPGATLLPNYTLSSWKLDRQNVAAQQLAPITITISATIYAQTGSWFVVPVPMEDLTNITNPSTQHQVRRLNYKLVMQGNISENFTPQPIVENYATATGYARLPGATNGELDPDNNPRGAMGQWLDTAAFPKASSGGLGTLWESVVYKRSVQKQSVDPDNMLYLPITPDITLQR